MKETSSKIEKIKQYIYTDHGRRNYFYFLIEKLITPMKAAKAASVNYHTARKWKQVYDNDPRRISR